MTGRTESTGLARKQEEVLLPTAGAADAGKVAHRIAAVEACCKERSNKAISCLKQSIMRSPRYLRSLVMAFGHIQDYRTEVSVLLLKTILIFCNKFVKIMKQHPVEHSPFRMTLTVNPCYGSREDSKIVPGRRLADIHPL
jgi:hypothetical protein